MSRNQKVKWPLFKMPVNPADAEIDRLNTLVEKLRDTLKSVCKEMNWGASALSAETIQKINEAGCN